MDGVQSKGVSVGVLVGHMDQVCIKMNNATLVAFRGSSSCQE